MANPTQGGATLKVFRAKVAITRGCLVRLTSVEEEVDLAGGDNEPVAVGYSTMDAEIGEPVTVQLLGGGGTAYAVAGGSIGRGDYVMAKGAAGAVQTMTIGASEQYVVGQALHGAASGDLFEVVPLNFVALAGS